MPKVAESCTETLKYIEELKSLKRHTEVRRIEENFIYVKRHYKTLGDAKCSWVTYWDAKNNYETYYDVIRRRNMQKNEQSHSKTITRSGKDAEETLTDSEM